MKAKTIGSVLAAAALMLGMLGFVIPVHAVVTPSISQSFGVTGHGVTALSVALPVAPLSGDAIVVFEWFGTTVNPCNFILTPTDSQAQAWGAVGNCKQDTLTGAMRAFAVSSYSSNVPDTVSCNFGGPNTQIEACYVFDVSSPGVITLLGSASGSGTSIQLAGNPSTALGNSLIFAAAGIETFCQSVNPGSGFTAYIPSSACYSTPYGMSGDYVITGTGGLSSNFPMSIGQSAAWAELVVQVAQPTVVTTTTIYTATVVGWLVPDATHFANTLMLIILPLAGMCAALIPFLMFQRPREIGDKAIYPALMGLTAGSALADLSVNGTSQLQIPFAFVMVSGILLFLWWWNS